ncbi:MAG TPA: hypothetical protein VGO11_15325 [Chthoniobacteraceae bacterium]|jgi:hypothetical protein|nr:hypothetical protein [Chthoniobacteraceae bacterium]
MNCSDLLRLCLFGCLLLPPGGWCAETAPTADRHPGPACLRADDFFTDEVWTKVGARTCLECHKVGGDAEDSKFILQDPKRDPDPASGGFLRQNRAAFVKMAALHKEGKSRLLVKATGGLSHGGDDVLKPDSTGYRILAEFVRRLEAPEGAPAPPAVVKETANFFDGIAMLDNRRLLRRATLSLAGRLPTPEELATVDQRGLPAFQPVLDGVMKEPAFYDRLAEAFNDIFLITGFTGLPDQVIFSYENFRGTRNWEQTYDVSSAGDEAAQRRARNVLYEVFRDASRREPLELIKYIVRENHPFTEIVTADFIMESPYTARAYGNFEEVKGRFQNPEDPFEFIPVRLAALTSPNRGFVQHSETGFYPHAGLLTTFQYLRRYPTTETNRNRLRGRMFYQQFLGVDVLELAARVKDAAAVTAKFEIPTMQASECVVCHRTLDPVAGLFQDFYAIEGVFGPRKDGWYKDMFGAGFEGEDLPAEQKWRALQWLGERTVKDPRFASTMVEHVYYILTGRRALLPPKAIDDPLFDAKQRAYAAQHAEIERIASRFVQAKFNLKTAFQEWIVSPFYRADGLSTAAANPQRLTELGDLGLARMLGPEQLERKLTAVFGTSWGKLTKQTALLYGGIDAKEVTERATDPSGAMGALQRTMANEVAGKNVSLDFALAAGERRLFPGLEPEVQPGQSPESDLRLRQTMAHLHELVLGRYDAVDSPEVTRTFELFASILADAAERKGKNEFEPYARAIAGGPRLPDPTYTIRAWRGVLTYLLRQRDFLYE